MSDRLLRACVEHLEPIHRALGVRADEPALQRLFRVWARTPEWVSEGYMPELDAVVVHEVVRAVAPRTMVEIGTASGVSICAAALGLEAAGALGDAEIHTYDCCKWCYFDESRLIGSAVGEMLPEHAETINVHRLCSTLDASREHAPGTIDVAVIDGDHRHPFPMIDLALLSRALAPGAWVILHDIYLPHMSFPDPAGGADKRYPHSGAEKLFAAWPWEKAEPAPGDYVNIGIVRVPEDGLNPERVASILSHGPYDEGVTDADVSAWLGLAGLAPAPS